MTFQFLRPTHFLQDSDGTFREVARFTPHAVNLVGHDDSVSDMYIPVIGALKFIIYNGWLHVSQVLINPLGDDDEDFNVDYIINRNIQISYLMVDGEEDDDQDDLEDPYSGALPAGLPHTVSSSAISATSTIFPTTKVTDSSPFHTDILPPGDGVPDGGGQGPGGRGRLLHCLGRQEGQHCTAGSSWYI